MPITLKASPTNNWNPWQNKFKLGDFFCHNYFTIWETSSKEKPWRHVFISIGIRRSDKLQFFPIWNTSDNCQKSLLFGCWKLYLEIGYRY